MTILLPTLAAAFTAFCVWLIVQAALLFVNTMGASQPPESLSCGIVRKPFG